VNQYKVSQVLASEYLKVAVLQNAVHDFQSSGIRLYIHKSLTLFMSQLLSLMVRILIVFQFLSLDINILIVRKLLPPFTLTLYTQSFTFKIFNTLDPLKPGPSIVTVHMIFKLVQLLSEVLILDGQEQ
jgi:hypothetical protein